MSERQRTNGDGMSDMTVRVNGERRRLTADISIEDVIAELVSGPARSDGGTPRGVAVAVNESVVPRGAWGTTRLHADDQIEIVQAVQGG